MISRLLEQKLKVHLEDNKALIILGPRQVGKTTLVKSILSSLDIDTAYWNGDEADIRANFENANSGKLKGLIGNSKLLVIDEAQRIQNIGLSLKLIIDQIPNVKVIATGSSSFDLANKINEPLTGRKWEFLMFPISYAEMVLHHGALEEKRRLDLRLIYGYYPDVVNQTSDPEKILKELASSYLYKDILTWERIQKPEKLERLLQALALQLGNEVSYQELAQLTGMDNQTVERYITLLEKSFIVFRLPSLNRNMRNELKKSRKIYFWDNGLRNAVINQFSPMSLRSDAGALWENFLMVERYKHTEYHSIHCNKYFWRTHAQQEIDYIEERNGLMQAYEFKWNPKSKQKISKVFSEHYPNSMQHIITPENFEEFVGASSNQNID